MRRCAKSVVNLLLKYCRLLWQTLYYIALFCIAFYCIAIYCTVLHCILLYCTVLYCIALHCAVLHYIVLYCIALQLTVLHCIVKLEQNSNFRRKQFLFCYFLIFLDLSLRNNAILHYIETVYYINVTQRCSVTKISKNSYKKEALTV